MPLRLNRHWEARPCTLRTPSDFRFESAMAMTSTALSPARPMAREDPCEWGGLSLPTIAVRWATLMRTHYCMP